MREDCKYFQSRMYSSGETVRFCALGLAPEAPWRCPENCPRFEKLLGDAGFVRGSLVEPHLEPEPTLDPDAVAVLGQAEEIIYAAGPAIVAEEDRRRRKDSETTWWQRQMRRWRR